MALIRAVEARDIPALLAIWNPLIRGTSVTFNSQERTEADLCAMIKARPFFHLAEEAGEPLGFASYGQFRTGPGYATCMEHTIILAPAARGRGIGRALMAAAEGHARAGGAHQMIAGVSGENPDGRAFHAALGYHEIARITEAGFKFGRYMDLILMRKFLT
jgi:phosphinothricin acetyltransferase